MDPIYQCKLKVGDRSFETYIVYKSHLDVEHYKDDLLIWGRTIILRNITSISFAPFDPNPNCREFYLTFHMGSGDQVNIQYQKEDNEKLDKLREAVLDIIE